MWARAAALAALAIGRGATASTATSCWARASEKAGAVDGDAGSVIAASAAAVAMIEQAASSPAVHRAGLVKEVNMAIPGFGKVRRLCGF
jgi:hypothetical protein